MQTSHNTQTRDSFAHYYNFINKNTCAELDRSARIFSGWYALCSLAVSRVGWPSLRFGLPVTGSLHSGERLPYIRAPQVSASGDRVNLQTLRICNGSWRSEYICSCSPRTLGTLLLLQWTRTTKTQCFEANWYEGFKSFPIFLRTCLARVFH
jgi:hypothetical protein